MSTGESTPSTASLNPQMCLPLLSVRSSYLHFWRELRVFIYLPLELKPLGIATYLVGLFCLFFFLFLCLINNQEGMWCCRECGEGAGTLAEAHQEGLVALLLTSPHLLEEALYSFI